MIYTGIGDKLGIFIQWSTTFVAGIVIAFVRHWELTLLLLLKEGAFVGLSKLLSKLLSKVGGDTMRSILSGENDGEGFGLLELFSPPIYTYTVNCFIYKQDTQRVRGCRGSSRGSALLHPNCCCFWRRVQRDPTVCYVDYSSVHPIAYWLMVCFLMVQVQQQTEGCTENWSQEGPVSNDQIS